LEKSAKTRFLYSHEYRDQKMGGKNARNNFSRNTRILREKYVGEKIVGKKCEDTFFKSHECRDLKWGKTCETKFSRNKPIERTKNEGEKRAKQFIQKLNK